MKRYILSMAVCASLLSMNAQNKMNVVKTDGQIDSYTTSQVSSVEFDNSSVVVKQSVGDKTYTTGDLKSIGFQIVSASQINIQEVGGWYEAGYVEFILLEGINTYNVYYRKAGASTWTQLDGMLVRNYGTYGRADAVGLTPGDYQFKVVGVDASKKEITTSAIESAVFTVKAHDRSGFAHFNYSEGIGAYNNDGSLKSDARVIYVTATTAKTVSVEVTGAENNPCVGLQTIIAGYQKGKETRPLAVRIIGTVKDADMDYFGSSAEGLQIKGKAAYSKMPITIEGIGEDATIHGFGMLVRNCTGVELRNFALMNFMDDGISFDTDNSNCWVHHVDFFYGKAGSASDQAKGDGSLDLKAGTKYMTLSYLHFWDSGKMSLCGMGGDEENYISYHHNWFDHTDSRHPRVRNMTVHVWNNYYDGCSKYGVGATTGSDIFVENNYFRNTNKPMMISLQGTDISGDGDGTFSGETGGMIKSYGNEFAEKSSNFRHVTYQQNAVEFDAYEANSRTETVPSSVKCKSGGDTYNNFDTNSSLMYTYTPLPAADVPAAVMASAGRMHGGDFKWTFNNSTEDRNYDVIAALKTAVEQYKSTLKGFIGTGIEVSVPGQGGNTGNEGEGGNTGGDNNDNVVSGSVTCEFDGKKPSNSAFSVTGNYKTGLSKTINGKEYTTALKMESATEVTFTIQEEMTLTIVTDGAEGKKIKIDGEKTPVDGNGYVILTLTAGTHTITKGDSMNVYYISLQ